VPRWAALDAARSQAEPRVPWWVGGLRVGSVARAHRGALARWPHWIDEHAEGLHLRVAADERDAVLAEINLALREAGLIVAWRDETYPVLTALGAAPLARIERAASRFWGTLTFGAHCNGYVAGADGRPSHLWIARRALTKPTDPGKLDNLVGGGVPHGQTPRETLLREGFEEAGLDAATMARATAGGVVELACDIPEGFMHEQIHAFDLRLERDVVPVNQDGEVAEIKCLAVDEALARAAGGEMTTDATLVTLDFALRHRLLPASEAQALAPRLRALQPTA
jgi:8-oxo-dGTP pyrophosphatase MutT (NUDIX family)